MKKSIALALGLFAAAAAQADSFSNGSFETSNVSMGTYAYAGGVTADSWSFTGGAGISNSSFAWGGAAFDGTAYAFLQNLSSVAQSFYGAAGDYTITFSLAQRTNDGAVGLQKINVLFDGTALSVAGNTHIRPSTFGDDDSYGGWTTYSLTLNSVAAGSHTLSFNGLINAPDTTVFLDQVAVSAPVPEPETYAMLMAGLGLLGLAVRRRKQAA